MKKAVEMKKVEAAEETSAKQEVKRPQAEEMKQLNAMSKRLRMTAWRFVRRIQGSKDSATMMKRLEEAYAKVEDCILEMTNEQMMMFRFANLSDAEVAYLKKMLANYNA